MKIPYTYVVKCPDGTAYYGAKYGKTANPATFWKDYFTSSATMMEKIEQYGKDSFDYEIRRTFDNAQECLDWEHKVLRRLNAAKRDDMVNKTIGGATDIAGNMIEAGTHHTLDMEWQKKHSNFCNPEWQREHGKVVAEYWANRTEPHPATKPENREITRQTQERLLSEGNHTFTKKKTCPDCGLKSSPSGIARHKCQGLNG